MVDRPTTSGDLVPMSTRDVRDSGLLRKVNEGLLHELGFALAIIAPVITNPLDPTERIVDVDSPRAGLAMVRSVDGTPIVYAPDATPEATVRERPASD